MSLRDVFERIVRNEYIREGIKEILSGGPDNRFALRGLRGHPRYNAYKAFVDCQIEPYTQQYQNANPGSPIPINRTLTPVQALRLEGFQGGVPWVGDIENAPVLFLSSNPAITPNQCTPRYHAYEDNWTIYHANDDGNGHKTPVHISPMKLDDLWNFYTYPLDAVRNPLGRLMEIKNPNANPLLTVNILEGDEIKPKPGGVKFWNDLVRNILVKLNNDPNAPKLLNRQVIPDNLNAADLTDLVNKAVFTEIVPFQSMGEYGVNDALDFCWNDFSQEILSRSKAKLWIVVGDKACRTLSGVMGIIPPLNTGVIYPINYGGRQRTLWAIPHPSAHGGAFNRFLDNTAQPINWTLLRNSI